MCVCMSERERESVSTSITVTRTKTNIDSYQYCLFHSIGLSLNNVHLGVHKDIIIHCTCTFVGSCLATKGFNRLIVS